MQITFTSPQAILALALLTCGQQISLSQESVEERGVGSEQSAVGVLSTSASGGSALAKSVDLRPQMKE